MKKLKKAEMVLKGQVPVPCHQPCHQPAGSLSVGGVGPLWLPRQVQHVHAELEVMSEADETNEWVVKLHYSFQVSEATPRASRR